MTEELAWELGDVVSEQHGSDISANVSLSCVLSPRMVRMSAIFLGLLLLLLETQMGRGATSGSGHHRSLDAESRDRRRTGRQRDKGHPSIDVNS